MQYISHGETPLGAILLAGDALGLTGLWFEGQKYFGLSLGKEYAERELPVFALARRWLALYFSGEEPDFSVPLHLPGTAFQKAVWEKLCAIPYGQVVSYGELARAIAAERGAPRMSARAVGGAVGRNAISILVPCHRVVGADGSLRGYAGGPDRKLALLRLEGALKEGDVVPGEKGTTRKG